MKAIVEWGIPQHSTKREICGISGQFVAPCAKQAAALAVQLVHTFTEGASSAKAADFAVSAKEPRKTFWSSDRSRWISVSILDGVMRGPYSGIADRDAKTKTKIIKL